MTALDLGPVDVPLFDDLAVIADPWTAATGKPFADRFRAACAEIARRHDDMVDPNAVRALMLDDSDMSPSETRRYSALWSWADSTKGFLDRTDVPVQINGATSRGNGNKRTVYRRWRAGVPRTSP